ncbi:hypothetical protein THAOC_28245, partial [Thalassiosira oceanica]
MKTEKKGVVKAPSLDTMDLKALVSLSEKILSARQKNLSSTVKVKVEGEADKEVSMIQERTKEYRKAMEELEVGTKLAYAHYRGPISKLTMEIMKAYPDSNKVERDSILVGEGCCLFLYLIMAKSKVQSSACKPLATALSIIRFISTYQKQGIPHTKFHEGLTAASEAMATAGGGVTACPISTTA